MQGLGLLHTIFVVSKHLLCVFMNELPSAMVTTTEGMRPLRG